MNIIKLPPIFINNIDLTIINEQLRNQTAKLDWSSVISITEPQLEILLDGINLDDEVLNLDGGVGDHILDRITRYYDQLSPLVPPVLLEESKKKNKNKSNIKPTHQQTSFIETRYLPSENPQTDGQLFQSEIVIKSTVIPENVTKISANLETNQPPENLTKKVLLNPPNSYQIRQELEECILKDLLGPAGGEDEEVNETSVSERYLVGVLAPKNRNKDSKSNESESNLEDLPELQDDLAVVEKVSREEGNGESTTPPTMTMFPSSMGMTFCVDEKAGQLMIIAEWGQYERQKGEYSLKEDGTPKMVWKRYPRTGTTIKTLKEDHVFQWVVCPEEAPSVYVEGKMRLTPNFGWIVTLFLVNGQTEPSKSKDSAWLFQSKLTVKSANPQNPAIFVKKPLPYHLSRLDPLIQLENQSMAMLYRHQTEFAVGHGVSVNSYQLPVTSYQSEVQKLTEDENSSSFIPHHSSLKSAVSLSTSAIPSYEVPKTTPPTVAEIPDLEGLELDMKVLAQSPPKPLIKALKPLIQAYFNWIQQQELKLKDPSLQEYQTEAKNAIANCQKALQRIEEGIKTLETNPQALESFQFMNQAMYLQRLHSLYAEKQRRGENITLDSVNLPKNRSWYPFQLAFILINIPSLTDLNHQDRVDHHQSIADLLWFPTGGGKTEAYLGLTAYTIAIRRLQKVVCGRDGEKGVAVLMRYTLRLLTLQQFQRATTLICACESIRRENELKWGTEPMRIGLWVGNKTTPNYTAQAEEFVKQVRGNSKIFSGGTPHQLTNCPWCGSKIEAGKHIEVESFEKGRGRTLIKCGDPLSQCIFAKGEGLPIVVVDEEIYRRLPTLLIATVDKFAQMPWKGETQMLFGQINGYCERHGFRSPDLKDSNSHKQTGNLPSAKTLHHPKLRPPDLIIQDELHLISGPLGTMVGLYETAIDYLAIWEVNDQQVRPKIIASTATIKQAQSQIYNLFQRRLQIFPPQCIDIQDNFFSRQRKPDSENPGRLYLGICAPGRRLKATMIRVYLAILGASQFLYEKYGELADPWMTLVGYFNSLRELGGTRRLVDDDINTRLRKMSQRGLSDRTLRSIDELTSRKTATDIPEILDRLEIPFNPQKEAQIKAKRQANQKVDQPYPFDVVLATNMISVGVDVKRLGVMVVCGQPKNTAEYIQATSRVGRNYPGLVITVYNWARPRDLSHYERFNYYHATFYQNVEALSLTPFAEGALYRGLSALFVSLVRLMGVEFNSNDQAGTIERNHPYIQRAIEAIVKRATLIEGNPTGDQVRRYLEAKLDSWLSASNTRGGATLKYQVIGKDGTAINLLENAGNKQWKDFTCLNSLRNVEPSINLVLTDHPPDDDPDRFPQPFHSKQ